MSHVTRLFKCILRNCPSSIAVSPECVLFSRYPFKLHRECRGFHSLSADFRDYTGSSTVNPKDVGATSTEKAKREQECTTVYVNELCMQMDQLMFNCKDHEDLLVLLVTHRGAMFLHNLVTALKLLQSFAEQGRLKAHQPDADDLFSGFNEVFKHSEKQSGVGVAIGDDGNVSNSRGDTMSTDVTSEVDENRNQELEALTETEKQIVKRANEEILHHFENPANQHYLRATAHSRPVAEAIVRDERYDLLMHDLYANRTNLDVESACHVIIALDSLQHKYFRLYNGILRHLMRLPLDNLNGDSANRIGKLLLKTCHCYVKAGYYDSPLYSKVCREIYKRPLEQHHYSVETELLMESLKLFSKVDVYDPSVFIGASSMVTKVPLTADDISHVALAYAAHHNYTKLHDDVLEWVSKEIQKRASEFTIVQLARCVYAFANMRLYFQEPYNILIQRLTDDVERATRSYAKTALTIPQIASIVQLVSNYAPHSLATKKLIHNLMVYLEDFIEEINEESAINMAFAICATECQGELRGKDDNIVADLNRYMTSFIWRIIGSGTEWERHKYRIFAIWLFHILMFPELDMNIPKRCVVSGMREWLLRHGNGPQFPEEFDDIVHILHHEIGLKMDPAAVASPGSFNELGHHDLMDPISLFPSIVVTANGKTIKILMNEKNCRNHPYKPIGVDLIVQNLIRSRGIPVHSINYQHWRSMDRKAKIQHLEEIIQQIDDDSRLINT
ncbi:hypothetical protein BgAZ_303040 [Babesia gibsoni]|uniref:RAP domain-containing protein n=1 Tax=Babesia gibsoni TaxID=33632 RepID=A0AAD8PDW9_BABGI|nr:hypothetical protein BgAZ_303040 [Babesia gibsoni]